MTVSNTHSRARSQYTLAWEQANRLSDQAHAQPTGLARLPLLMGAVDCYAKAWGIADLAAALVPARDFGYWDVRRSDALKRVRRLNELMTELVRLEVAA